MNIKYSHLKQIVYNTIGDKAFIKLLASSNEEEMNTSLSKPILTLFLIM